MSLSLPLAKKAKLSLPKQINDLADADLCAIFERLPPYDRLTISEVSCRWNELSRKAWLDIAELDLTPIPGKRIGAIVRQCPNLQSVVARKKFFGLNELAALCKPSSLSSVKLYDCSFAVKSDLSASFDPPPYDILSQLFSENLQHASFRELILHEGRVEAKSVSPISHGSSTHWSLAVSFLPASLTRLQLSYLHDERGRIDDWNQVDRGIIEYTMLLLNGLYSLQGLECLMLHQPDLHGFPNSLYASKVYRGIVKMICALKNLRELSVGPAWLFTSEHDLGCLVTSLPKLEVLLLNDIGDNIAEDLAKVITKNRVLRILILSGRFYRSSSSVEPIELPARKRFPHGFGSDPLPLLHIFVGKEASERIRFATSPSDAAIIHPISEPMPQFLERKDIAPIFECVWIAEKIKETAQFGGELWSYAQHDRAT